MIDRIANIRGITQEHLPKGENRVAKKIQSTCESLSKKDNRFIEIQTLREVIDKLIDVKVVLKNIQNAFETYQFNNLGEIYKRLEELRDTIAWDDKLIPPPELNLDLDLDEKDRDYLVFISNFVERQLSLIEPYIEQADKRMTAKAAELVSEFKEINDFLPQILDELLDDLDLEIDEDQRKKIKLFLINPTSGWKMSGFVTENTHHFVRAEANAGTLDTAYLLSPKDVLKDVMVVKHELVHRLRLFGYISQDIKIPIASAIDGLESYRWAQQEGWKASESAPDYYLQLSYDIKKYDLDVIFVYYVLESEPLSSLEEATNKIREHLAEKTVDIEPLDSYDQGHRLAYLAIVIEEESAKTDKPLTAQQFLAGLAKGKLPSEVYSFIDKSKAPDDEIAADSQPLTAA